MEESSGVIRMKARKIAGLRTRGLSEIRSTESQTARKLFGRPCAAGTPVDGHLAGLLTYASTKVSAFPDISSGMLLTVLGDYSCGAVADSHRASQITRCREATGEGERGQAHGRPQKSGRAGRWPAPSGIVQLGC